jgi:hypothetical protein
MQRAPMRRTEDKIRKLCQGLLAATDDEDQIQKLRELRHELRRYVEALRAHLARFPIVERRDRDHTSVVEMPLPQDVRKGTGT